MEIIFNVPHICHKLGVEHAILCPGSRNAPLSIAFERCEHIQTHIISDERSAGYIALGIAQSTRKPVVVCTTSGTAVSNLIPAVTEAFFQKLPLIVLTADRPLELIHQGDGQAIDQQGVFDNHILYSKSLYPDYHSLETQRLVERCLSEALIESTQKHRMGPSHVNFPFREPFYPKALEGNTIPINLIKEEAIEPSLSGEQWNGLNNELKGYQRILVVCGQFNTTLQLTEDLNLMSAPVIAECTSNVLSEDNVIKYHDVILNPKNEKTFDQLRPDLVITFGENLLSKNLKQFIRSSDCKHWHIGHRSSAADVFGKLTRIIPVSAEYFFHQNAYEAVNSGFLANWLYQNNISKLYTSVFLNDAPFGEFKAISQVHLNIPPNAQVHYSNSMPIRYGNLFPIAESKKARVFCNRGTSGIDGSTSTVVGQCIAKPDQLQIFITGDMSFFYDRNAFWNNEDLSNLRIILLNNNGGGIFNMIPGPKAQPELEKNFLTKQTLSATDLANEHNFEYYLCDSQDQLDTALASFFTPSKNARLIEVHSTITKNTEVFDEFKSLKNYGL